MMHLALLSCCHEEVGQAYNYLFNTTFSFQKQAPQYEHTAGSSFCNRCGQTCIHGHHWEHTIGLGYQDCWVLNLCRKERQCFSITLLLHVAFDDSKDHLYPLQEEQFSFILCPGQVKQFTTQKKKHQQNNNLPPPQ